MTSAKKLYWLEYTSVGPLLPLSPFQAIGFEVEESSWTPQDTEQLMHYVVPQIKAWRPDILAFVISYIQPTPASEPAEWLTACQLLRADPNLQHMKLMAFLIYDQITPEQEAIWRQRYDYFTNWPPLKGIEHGKVAKELAGEAVIGYEGANWYLNHTGSWTIQDVLLGQVEAKGNLSPNAEGKFSYPSSTRLLSFDIATKRYGWLKEKIKTDWPTAIVYVMKDLPTWQKGLSQAEMSQLAALAQTMPPTHQRLIGANETLLQADPAVIRTILQQAEQAGGWQVFLIEHLWLEGAIGYKPTFRELVYGQSFSGERMRWPISI